MFWQSHHVNSAQILALDTNSNLNSFPYVGKVGYTFLVLPRSEFANIIIFKQCLGLQYD